MNIKKISIGYIYASLNLDKEDKLFLNLAKKKNIELVMINLSKKINEQDFEKKINPLSVKRLGDKKSSCQTFLKNL